jgi:hypothetical protein
MSLFLTDQERTFVGRQRYDPPLNRAYQILIGRARRRAESPGLTKLGTTTEWWYHAAEYVSDVAMAYALEPDERLGAWVRDVTLSLVRRPQDDWVGPFFRNHRLSPPIGHLETAHLCLAVVSALDLAPDVFSEAERDEATAALRDRGIPMCLRWLERAEHLNNWRAILMMGLAVSAAYLNDPVHMERAAHEFELYGQAFQPDGSYSESLQYSNYAMYGLALTYEALVRRDPDLAASLSLAPYARGMRWAAYSYFYSKPLPDWGPYPLPRSANFNDCAATYRPSGDVLLHIATRAREEMPVEAGLARWLFDTNYLSAPSWGTSDRATFGLLNDFGFLTLPLLPQAAEPRSPAKLDLPPMAAFSNGDILSRNGWDGRTVLAVHGGGDPLHAPSHLHGDLNSFILVHNQERLLLDPGHSCYRNLMRSLDISTRAHNTCTFTAAVPSDDARQEEQFSTRVLEQTTTGRRSVNKGEFGDPFERGGQRLLAAQRHALTALGSEAGRLYGSPIEQFARFWFLCGEHVLFIVDAIYSAEPVRTTWHWLLNNRDDRLELEVFKPDHLIARRGNAGLKLFHLGSGVLSGPTYAYVHDAYHPLPNQRGEGEPGSGLRMQWQEPEPRTERIVAHAVAMDSYGAVDGWHMDREENEVTLSGPHSDHQWTLRTASEPLSFTIRQSEVISYHIGKHWDTWQLQVIEQSGS